MKFEQCKALETNYFELKMCAKKDIASLYLLKIVQLPTKIKDEEEIFNKNFKTV